MPYSTSCFTNYLTKFPNLPHPLEKKLKALKKLLKVSGHNMDNKQNQGRGRKVSCEQAVSEKGAGLLGVKDLSKRQETVTEEL